MRPMQSAYPAFSEYELKEAKGASFAAINNPSHGGLPSGGGKLAYDSPSLCRTPDWRR